MQSVPPEYVRRTTLTLLSRARGRRSRIGGGLSSGVVVVGAAVPSWPAEAQREGGLGGCDPHGCRRLGANRPGGRGRMDLRPVEGGIGGYGGGSVGDRGVLE